MSRIQLRKPLSPVKLKNPLLLRNALIKVFLNRNWTILHVQVYIQEKIVVFLVENVLYSNESLLSIPCGMVHCTVTRNDQSTEQNTFKKNQKLVMIVTDYICQLSTNKIRFRFYNEVKRNLTQLTTRRAVACCRSAVSAWWLKRGQPCLHHLHVLCTAFPGGLSLHLAFGSFFLSFYPHPSPLSFFPLINQCDRCLVSSVWGLMAGRRGFTRG